MSFLLELNQIADESRRMIRNDVRELAAESIKRYTVSIKAAAADGRRSITITQMTCLLGVGKTRDEHTRQYLTLIAEHFVGLGLVCSPVSRIENCNGYQAGITLNW